jgi:hypothetical protein
VAHGIEAGGPLDLIDDPRYLERLRRAVADLRSIRDQTQDDPFRFGRVCRPEHGNAVSIQGGDGPRHSGVVRHGPEPTLDGWIEVDL